MMSCPADETLASLLADALSTAEQDALAQHVEACVACQERLSRLSETSDVDTWQHAERLAPSNEAEEEISCSD